MSYVANCGREDGAGDGPDAGVFFNHNMAPANWIRVTSSELLDGAQQTLLYSENIQASQWVPLDGGGAPKPPAEVEVGMVWWPSPDSCSLVNQCIDVGSTTTEIRYARPSANHSGGVMVTFCDGHQDFLADDLDYNIFRHLMTPNSSGAGVPATPAP